MRNWKDNLYLVTLFVYLELKHPGKIITNIALETVDNPEKPHKATVTFGKKKGNKIVPGGTISLTHQRECTWDSAKKKS